MAESFREEISTGGGSREKNKLTINKRRKKARTPEERPFSLELETDLTNTETKLVILDFLSSQPKERLTARNDPEKIAQEQKPSRKLSKSSSDGSSHESYRVRYAKLAKSARPLRKQYSLRLKQDLHDYLKSRGKSLDDLSSCRPESADSTASEDDDGAVGVHQRSYTEGDAYYSRRFQRRISDELRKGIVEFNTSRLKHVPDRVKNYDQPKLKEQRPENLEIPLRGERRLSPVLSPESHVAARLELISQEILTTYPDLFNEQISKVSLQDLTYEKFASIARRVLEKYPGGWTKVALVCYFARELALEDESTDDQLEKLVEFSSKFISDTSAEWIASQGGWSALEDNDEDLSPFVVRKKLKEEPDFVDGVLKSSPNSWLGYAKYYGFAALAVGVTFAYHMTRYYY